VVLRGLQGAGLEGLFQGMEGAPELGVAALVDARDEQRVEQRALLRGEPDVGAGQRGQPLLGRIAVPYLRRQCRGEGAHRVDADRREQVVTVGGMTVGGGDRHPEAAAGFGRGEAPPPPLGYQADRRVDKRRLEVAMVVAAALGGPFRWCIGPPWPVPFPATGGAARPRRGRAGWS